MTNKPIATRFARLSTPLVSDACLRTGAPYAFAPSGIRPVRPGMKVAGRALPVRHHGSVDVFLEVLEHAEPGDVMVIDNAGRLDEGCIGDLIALECKLSGLGGIVVWGVHRDSADVDEIRLPVFSYGTCGAGPRRLDRRHPDATRSAAIGLSVVGPEQAVFADDDGVLFVPLDQVAGALEVAEKIWVTERAQAEAIRAGSSLRSQVRFAEYLAARDKDPSLTFRQHLRRVGGAVEE